MFLNRQNIKPVTKKWTNLYGGRIVLKQILLYQAKFDETNCQVKKFHVFHITRIMQSSL